MPRTLLVTLDYPPMTGGVANYYHNIVQQLPQDSIWVLDNTQNELLFRSRFIWPKWLKGLWSTVHAVRLLRIEHLLVGQVLPIGTIALILHKFMHIQYTVMTHAMDVTILTSANNTNKRKQWLLKNILKNASAVTTVSRYTAQKLHEYGVEYSKIHIIEPCPHIDGTTAAVSDEQIDALNAEYHLSGKKVILTVTRLVERKGIDMVITALPRILDKIEDAVYIVVGDGPYREVLEKIVRVRGLQKNVLFIGKVTDEQLPVWYSRCDLFVMPSRELPNGDVEGFGIVFLEAGSFGKPVVAGNSGGIADAVIDGETGFLVDPTDDTMIADAVIAILRTPEGAATMGHNAQQRVQTYFQWPTKAKKLQSILEHVDNASNL